MKTTRLTLIIPVLLIAAFCFGFKSDGTEFVGKWRPITYRVFPKRAVLTIEKEGKQYIVNNSLSPEQPLLMTYFAKRNMLIVAVSGGQMYVTYDAKKDHIKFATSGTVEETTFERIK